MIPTMLKLPPDELLKLPPNAVVTVFLFQRIIGTQSGFPIE